MMSWGAGVGWSALSCKHTCCRANIMRQSFRVTSRTVLRGCRSSGLMCPMQMQRPVAGRQTAARQRPWIPVPCMRTGRWTAWWAFSLPHLGSCCPRGAAGQLGVVVSTVLPRSIIHAAAASTCVHSCSAAPAPPPALPAPAFASSWPAQAPPYMVVCSKACHHPPLGPATTHLSVLTPTTPTHCAHTRLTV
jgi:hypothetical protein